MIEYIDSPNGKEFYSFFVQRLLSAMRIRTLVETRYAMISPDSEMMEITEEIQNPLKCNDKDDELLFQFKVLDREISFIHYDAIGRRYGLYFKFDDQANTVTYGQYLCFIPRDNTFEFQADVAMTYSVTKDMEPHCEITLPFSLRKMMKEYHFYEVPSARREEATYNILLMIGDDRIEATGNDGPLVSFPMALDREDVLQRIIEAVEQYVESLVSVIKASA